ncbi:hypothetical protein KQI68_05735 [Peptoniphilus sp. MSJ-1]|uniref:Uncharacterized protein n=1 Tax=Peptoniphilus ovalis TaxID=2841503 RepID=A0ABS6FGP2_9FIRM|nr:hypothetical protein [Peptoniphilus ovalis]MBU5669339.1 hypothetical protein [Peptoniphilus ovalis]
MINRIIKILIVIFILLAGIALFFYFAFSPTPKFMRNNDVDGIKLNVKVGIDERLPIIRTYKLKEYQNLSQDKKDKIKEKIGGKVEGDIPSIHLVFDNKLYFTFEKDGEIIAPENPKIKIYASASDYRDDTKVRVIEGDLSKDSNNRYFYESKRYGTQYERYFMEYLRIEVYYSINGEDYISTFAVFQDNAREGTDFFDNVDLDSPIPPQ